MDRIVFVCVAIKKTSKGFSSEVGWGGGSGYSLLNSRNLGSMLCAGSLETGNDTECGMVPDCSY